MRKAKSRLTYILLLALALAAVGIPQASAATFDAAGAAALQKLVAQDMQWRIDMAKMLGRGITMDGTVSVAPDQNSYKITLPHVAVMDEPRGLLYVGTVVLHAAPGKLAGSWKINGALPRSMVFVTARKKPVADITVGEQNFSALWLPGAHIYPKLDTAFKKIKISIAGKIPATVDVGSFESHLFLEQGDDGKWNGGSNFKISGIALHAAGKNPVSLTIANATDHSVYKGIDVAAAEKLRSKIEAALKKGLPQTPQERQAFIATFMINPPVAADDLSDAVQIDDIAADMTGGKEKPGMKLFLRRISISGKTENAQEEKSRVRATVSLDGFGGTFISPTFADLVPRDFRINVALSDLPLRAITETFLGAVRKFASVPAGDKAAQKMAAADLQTREMMLPALMAKTGTSLSVQDTYARNGVLDIGLSGNVYANSAAASGAVGKMSLSIAGLDKIIPKMKKEALAPNADPRLLVYLGEIIGLEKKGIASKVNGKPARLYILDLTKSGSVLLNGTEIRPSPAEQTGMDGPEKKQQAPAAQTSPSSQKPQGYPYLAPITP